MLIPDQPTPLLQFLKSIGGFGSPLVVVPDTHPWSAWGMLSWRVNRGGPHTPPRNKGLMAGQPALFLVGVR